MDENVRERLRELAAALKASKLTESAKDRAFQELNAFSSTLHQLFAEPQSLQEQAEKGAGPGFRKQDFEQKGA